MHEGGLTPPSHSPSTLLLFSTRDPLGGESDLSEIVTFMKMVITRVENGSPDMIPVAFERKFNEKFDEIPPGIYRHHIFDFFQYLEVWR